MKSNNKKLDRDKNYFQDFTEKNFKPYDWFFDTESKYFLHLIQNK